MILDSPLANHQVLGNFLVGFALGKQGEHFTLAASQRGFFRTGGEMVKQAGSDHRLQQQSTLADHTDRRKDFLARGAPFNRCPLARLMALRIRSSVSKAVNTMASMAGYADLMRCSATTPSMPGISKSSKITSGWLPPPGAQLHRLSPPGLQQ